MKPFTKIVVIFGLIFLLMSGGMNMVSAGTPSQTDVSSAQDPVLVYFSGFTGLETETIFDYQNQGYPLGELAQAFHLTTERESLDLTPVLTQAKELGWVVVYQQLRGDQGEFKGLGWLFKEEGKPGTNTDEKEQPDQANNDKANNDQDKTNNGNANSDKVTGPPEQANNDKDKEKENNGKGNDKVKP